MKERAKMTENSKKISCAEAGSAASCVLKFIKDTESVCLHDFLMIRGGKVFSEMSYHGILPSQPQRIYSATKTFVGAAIGMLIYDGYLSLDDKIIDILYTESEYDEINDLTLRDCLRMASCHDKTTYTVDDKNWLDSFFKTKPSHPSGTVFRYDTSVSYVLGVIVENICDMKLMDYLRMKMNLSREADCIESPEGYSWAGSGGTVTLYDMAKLGELYMNGGVLNGVRLMSEEYAKASVSKQTDNDSGFNHRWKDGYGYQIWLTSYGYVFYGMGSQAVVCVPDKNFIFVCCADTLEEPIYGKILEDALIADIVDTLDSGIDDTYEDNKRLALYKGEFPLMNEVKCHIGGNGRYVFKENPMGITEMTLDCENGIFEYVTPRGKKQLCFGKNSYKDSVFPETHYFGHRISTPAGRGYKYTAAGAWTEKHTFRIKVWILDEHIGGINITVSFKNNEVALCMKKHGEWILDEYNGFAGGYKAQDNA